MADEGLRRLFRETCHCSRCRADAPGAGEAAARMGRRLCGNDSAKTTGTFSVAQIRQGALQRKRPSEAKSLLGRFMTADHLIRAAG
jgi:hypothetical protein